MVTLVYLNSNHTQFIPLLVTITDSTRGWPTIGLLTLPTTGEREQGRG